MLVKNNPSGPCISHLQTILISGYGLRGPLPEDTVSLLKSNMNKLNNAGKHKHTSTNPPPPYTHTHTRTHTHAHTRTHARMHAHTHTHTQPRSQKSYGVGIVYVHTIPQSPPQDNHSEMLQEEIRRNHSEELTNMQRSTSYQTISPKSQPRDYMHRSTSNQSGVSS